MKGYDSLFPTNKDRCIGFYNLKDKVYINGSTKNVKGLLESAKDAKQAEQIKNRYILECYNILIAAGSEYNNLPNSELIESSIEMQKNFLFPISKSIAANIKEEFKLVSF